MWPDENLTLKPLIERTLASMQADLKMTEHTRNRLLSGGKQFEAYYLSLEYHRVATIYQNIILELELYESENQCESTSEPTIPTNQDNPTCGPTVESVREYFHGMRR